MQRFLVALDPSERAGGVLAAAASLATRIGAELVLVRATGVSGELPPEAYASDPDEIAKVLVHRAGEELEALAKGLAPGLVQAVRVEQGRAWEVICRVAGEENVDLVVIGAHGYGAVERFLGTVASKVVNHADRPVLVVRHPERVV